MTDRRPCYEPPAPRPSPHSHGQPPRVRSAGRRWLMPASDQNRYLTVRKAHASGSVDSARCSRDAPSATPLALCRSSHSCSSRARTPAPATARAQARDPNDLVGVVWVLDETSIERLVADVPTGAQVTLTFEDGQASGSAACNSYGGAYEAGDDGSLSFDAFAVTQMACDPAADDARDAPTSRCSAACRRSRSGPLVTSASRTATRR